MKKLFVKIDNQGNYLCDELLEKPTEKHIDLENNPIPEGLYLPRFLNGVWVEGNETAKNEHSNSKSNFETLEALEKLDNHRDTEELIDLLISKGVISIEELPIQVIKRQNEKKTLRSKL